MHIYIYMESVLTFLAQFIVVFFNIVNLKNKNNTMLFIVFEELNNLMLNALRSIGSVMLTNLAQ